MTPPATHELGPTRARVLATLQSADAPQSVSEVAALLGLHKNSIRFHLDALVESGYAHRAPAPNGKAGRPPLRYSATLHSPTLGTRHLIELSEVLLDTFVSSSRDALAKAEHAGRVWGERACAHRQEGDDATTLVTQLTQRGFATTLSHEHGAARLTFTRCPFRDCVSPERLALVCAVHQGFIDGVLKTQGAAPAARLQVGPKVCHTRLTTATP